MIFKGAIVAGLVVMGFGANALQNSPIIRQQVAGTGFGAPTISGKDNVSPVSEGDLVYDSLDGIFFGYNGSSWNSLSVGVASGTSSYHSPTQGQIVYDTTAAVFKGYNGTGWITFNASVAGVPAGTVITTAATSCATGYIAADGSSVLRTGGTECGGSGCDNLFAAIGTTYGSADGSHFTLPNAQGVFVRGAGSQTIGSVSYSGTQGTAQNDALQNITGNYPSVGGAGTTNGAMAQGSVVAGVQGNGPSNNVYQFSFDASRVARTSTETRPGNIVLKYCIAY